MPPSYSALIPLLLISNVLGTENILQGRVRNIISTETYSVNTSMELMTLNDAVVQKEIFIDLGQQMMFLFENDILIRMYPISSGKALTPTPIGLFQVYRKQDLRISRQTVPYRMPYYLSFTKNGAYGMHALPYLGVSPSSSWYWSEALDHIGIPVSHGCVRLLPENALTLYEWAEVGIPITISYTTTLSEHMVCKM